MAKVIFMKHEMLEAVRQELLGVKWKQELQVQALLNELSGFQFELFEIVDGYIVNLWCKELGLAIRLYDETWEREFSPGNSLLGMDLRKKGYRVFNKSYAEVKKPRETVEDILFTYWEIEAYGKTQARSRDIPIDQRWVREHRKNKYIKKLPDTTIRKLIWDTLKDRQTGFEWKWNDGVAGNFKGYVCIPLKLAIVCDADETSMGVKNFKYAVVDKTSPEGAIPEAYKLMGYVFDPTTGKAFKQIPVTTH